MSPYPPSRVPEFHRSAGPSSEYPAIALDRQFHRSVVKSAKSENLEITLSTLPGHSEYRIDLLLREPDFRLLGTIAQLLYLLNVEVSVFSGNLERSAVAEIMIVGVDTTRSNSP